MAEPCSAAVRLDGAAQQRDIVRGALAERGIASSPHASCHVVTVRVQPRQEGMLLELLGDNGDALAERVVSDAKTAAAVIESWSRPELYAMLLPEPPAPVVETDAPLSPQVLPVSATRSWPRSVLSAGVVSAVGGDGSQWIGASAGGCVRFGALCVGAMVRASQDTRASGDSSALQTSRTAMELLLAIDLSRRVGSIELTSGALAGIGTNRRRRDDAEEGTVEADGGGLRAGFHFGLAKPISAHWAIAADASVDAAIFAPSGTADEDSTDLATQPRAFMRLALQLRYEVR